MVEYIEREAVLALKKPFPTSKDTVTLYQQYFISPTAVEKIPAADVVPVRHGRWLEHKSWAKCSWCGYLLGFETPYCPNCGADMREVDT